MPLRKIISTTWPWDHGRFDQDDVVRMALDLGADEICIRTPAFTSSYNPAWHSILAKKLNDAGADVSLWPVVALYSPEAEAQAIKQDIENYSPVRIFLDAETKRWTANLERFLAELGRLPIPVGLGSFRRANYHREMRWQVWLNAQVGGEYQIDFLAHQLYPIGWYGADNWVTQFRLDLDSHQVELNNAGRPDMPWMPWMPAFIGSGYEGVDNWKPPLQAVSAAVEYMKERLGDRLKGMNWWSLDEDLVDLPELYEYIKALPSGDEPAPPPDPTEPISIEVRVPAGVQVNVIEV